MRMKSLVLGLAALLMASSAHAQDPGVTDTEIKIGDVNILTGPASFIGRAVSVGSKLAATEINEAGGVNGRKIVIATEDDGYVPARSFQALKKLIEVDGIFALNGTSGTANVLAMMPLIEENNLPTVVTTAPSELIYDPVRPPVFTIGARYQDAFFGQLKYIHENLEPENAVYGLIRQDDDFGVTVEQGYDRAIKELGVKDGIRLKYKRGTTNFSAEVVQMRAAGVNVLANGAIIAGAANVLSEARKLGMDLQVAAVWSEDMPPSVKLAAPAGYPYLVADYVALNDEATDAFHKLAEKYLSPDEVGAINRYSYITYVGLKVLAKAMEGCGKELTRACTIEQLRKIKDFDTGGLTAPISFDNEKQLSGTALKIYQLDPATQTFKTLVDFTDYSPNE
ncbi:ABC transporter substrate-binding protein [Rhodoligotrophos defluvii]|uniref:ABC transporter substrate-binding protein n=1 Tax=Rhodoligotrophos defluvii TaxID=2561934 RepID=UPI0014853EFE|nr:ABC transporter substrate-binding protein [Rhodoligotrophos defluvii]